jgi:transcriptional regulator with XRE-family HTH domain
MRLLIRKYRLERRMTQLALASKLGYASTSTISKLERGYYSPTVDELARIARVLDVPVTALIADNEAVSTTARAVLS